MITADSADERILKIGQYLAKLFASYCFVFLTHGVLCRGIRSAIPYARVHHSCTIVYRIVTDVFHCRHWVRQWNAC